MSQRRSRLQRKARRVLREERESEADKALGEARAERDKALHAANEAFRKGALELKKQQAEARKAAHDAYEQKRTEILKRFAEAAAA